MLKPPSVPLLRGMMATSLEDVVEAYHVGLDIGIGISDRIAHTSLGSKVHHDRWLIFLKYFIH